MKPNGLVIAAQLMLVACLGTVGHASAGEKDVKGEASAATQQADDQFKNAALKFVQSAQGYLAVTALQWQNFMFSPRADAVSGISRANADMKDKVADQFKELMATPGRTEAISEKIKDYYAAWDVAFDGMRPAPTEGGRSYSTRTNSEMRRMDAAAARLRLDLQ